MNRMLTISLVLLGIVVVFACDPVRMVIVRAAPKPNHSVALYGNENMKLATYPYLYDSIGRKIVIHVPTNDSIPHHELTFNDGRIGTWNDSEVERYSEFIDSIVINNDSGRLVLNSHSVIKDYLLGHRSGLQDHMIHIEAK